MRGKLDALLGLAEATDCRRVRLLHYFGQAYVPGRSPSGGETAGDGERFSGRSLAEETSIAPGAGAPVTPDLEATPFACMNCDNCLFPAQVWDGTDAARKLLSTIYRVQQSSGITFGAGHIMDIVRGKQTEKIAQHGHKELSTFGIGADLSEQQLRGVLRQLIAINAVSVDAQAFNTLKLTPASRAVLKGEVQVQLRASSASAPGGKARRGGGAKAAGGKGGAASKAPLPLDDEAQQRYAALRAWRAEVARSHNLPAYVIFHDTTLAAIAQRAPSSLNDLQGISGIGAKKLEAYGDEVLRVVGL